MDDTPRSKFSLVHLVGETTENAPRTLELTQTEQVIGRSERADFVVRIPSVSRRHATLWVKDGVPYVKDLGSQYGTFVNAEPISEPVALRQGDLVSLGGNLLFLVNQEEAEELDVVAGGEHVVDSSLVELALSAQAPEGRTRKYVEALYDLCLKAPVLTNESQLLSVVLQALKQLISAERFFAMVGEEAEALVVAAHLAQNPEKAGQWSLPSKEILRRAIASDKPIIAFDAKSDERFQNRASVAMSNVRSVICVGLRIGKTCLGVLYGDNNVRAGLFSLEDGDFVLAIARLATLALAQMRTKAHLQVALAEAATPGGLTFQGELLQHIQLHLDRLERAAVDAEKSEDVVTFARRVRAECRRLRVTLEDIRPQVPPGKPTTTLSMGGAPPPPETDGGAAELDEPEPEEHDTTDPQRDRPDLPDLPPRPR
jgi:GAF domain-containing protein